MKHLFGMLLSLILAVSAMPVAVAQSLPPLAKQLDRKETAIILVDFQARFTSPEQSPPAVKKFIEETNMLDKTVELVKRARALGILVVHVTEGYSQDYRELDFTNPGRFHRSQILRQAWKIGGKEAAYYEPLRPGPNDKDIFLAPRLQASGFGGTGLNEILRSLGIKNVAIAGFATDVCVYATTLAAYDLGFHVYALKDAMAPVYPELSALMLKEIYPFWSMVIGNAEFMQMFDGAGRAVSK